MKNIKKNLLVSILLFGVWTAVYSQITLKGKVLEQYSNAPISYANIGVLNTTTGTISNTDGSFAIEIPTAHLEKNLLFSAIGYEKRSLTINAFKEDTEIIIYLDEKAFGLDEVVISASTKKVKEKHSWLGNRKKNLLFQGMISANSSSAGAAMTLLIDRKEYPDLKFIDKASLFITKNTLPDFKIRVRFLEVGTNNLPGDDLFGESIIICSNIKRGWLDFDLSPYKYRISNTSFFIMFEWILDDKDRIDIVNRYLEFIRLNPDRVILDTIVVDGEKVQTTEFKNFHLGTIFGTTSTTADLKKYKCYRRTNSFGEWQRASGIISAKVLMSNIPPINSTSLTDEIIVSDSKTISKEATLESKIEKWGAAFIENYNIPGMQLSVSSKNNILFSEGFGYSDVANKKSVTPQNRFEIASVSKPITAAGMIKLAAEGKLDLDKDVRSYVPSFPEKKDTLTTRQLAAHLGGIRDYFEISIDEVIKNPHFENATEAIAVFKNDTLISKPGDEYLYSSFGYNLIGAVIEGASGQTYLEYMQNQIWKPLSMSNTYGDIIDSTIVNKSKFYYPNEEEALPYDKSYVHPGGGLISTTEDLLKFGNELLYGDFFKNSFKNKLFEIQYTSDKKPTNYGLGWYIGKDTNNHRIWYHAGQSPSSGAVLIMYPDDGIVISLLTNTPILVNSDDALPIEVQKLGELIYQD